MTLQTTGPIALADVNVELAATSTSTISLNDSLVRTLFAKSSGAISMQDGYGKRAAFEFTISSNQNNLDLRTAALNAGWNGVFTVIATIAPGVVINGSSGANALTINGSFPRGVELINNGTIVGAGGNGGAGGAGRGDQGTAFTPGTLGIAYGGGGGGAGSRALLVQVAATITNNGTIAGGGGGGGGGGATIANQVLTSTNKEGSFSYLNRQCAAGGGGGGAGRGNNFGSSGGAGGIRVRGSTNTLGNDVSIENAQAGGGGNLNTNGGGGFRGREVDVGDADAHAGSGGAGGGWGASGASGGGSSYWFPNIGYQRTASGAGGGPGGQAVNGNSNITWVAFGTRLGGIV
jgi:hypothetical protein